MKRFFAMAMAGVMTLSMGTVAFAAASDATQTLDIAGTVQAPTLNVVIPTAGSVVINPYGLEYEAGTDDEGDPIIKTDQIISPEDYIYNAGDVAVQASATVKATVAGKAVIAAKAPSETYSTTKPDTTKSVYLYAEFSNVVDHDGLITDPSTEVKGVDTFTFTDGYVAEDDILVSAKGATKTNAFTLDKVTGETDSEVTKVVAFRLAGEANGKAATAWTAEDSVTVNVTFDFLPTVVDEAP